MHAIERRWVTRGSLAATAIALSCMARQAHAQIAPRPAVRGGEITQVEMTDAAHPDGWRAVAWADLENPLSPGKYVLRWSIATGDGGGGERALEVPVCAGRGAIARDGAPVATSSPAPVVVPIPGDGAAHTVTVALTVSGYERRVACGAPARLGLSGSATGGVGSISFASPHAAAGGGTAVVFLPPGHDAKAPAALLVGAHPWNGGIWTYAAYAELLREAAARDVVLLFPSGLGNSLYTAAAEDEVLRALDALARDVAIDPRRVSIWGASMGGAGATTIGLHHPDRFASVTSFFGDAKYDLSTYVRAILPDEAAAHRVNALDVAENARHVPVWLIHGEDDRVSPIAQSEVLAQALAARGYAVRFDRVPRAGHEGALVARFARELVAKAAEARAPERPARVTYRSVRPGDDGAYGVRLVRSGAGDAFVDIERRADGVHLLRAGGVRAIFLRSGALGASASSDGAPPPIVVEAGARGVRVEWDERRGTQ